MGGPILVTLVGGPAGCTTVATFLHEGQPPAKLSHEGERYHRYARTSVYVHESTVEVFGGKRMPNVRPSIPQDGRSLRSMRGTEDRSDRPHLRAVPYDGQ